MANTTINPQQIVNLEQLLLDATFKAGKHLRDHAFNPGTIRWKKPGDPVTSRDTEAEAIIIDTLCKPLDMKIIGEESGYTANKHGISRYTAIIDPLDGTKSYLRKEFKSTISIAVEEDDQLIAGAVYDFMRDILYIGFRGETYLINNKEKRKFQTSLTENQTSIITNSGRRQISDIDKNRLRRFEQDPTFYLSRRSGSIALAMAHTALGIHDVMVLFHERVGNVWDIAAGTYLLQCTNHQITDIEGNPFNHHQPHNGIIAIQPKNKAVINRILYE